MLLDFLDLFFCLSLLHKDQLILAYSGIFSLKKFKTSKKVEIIFVFINPNNNEV